MGEFEKFASLSVLVVEDNEHMMRLLKAMLRALGVGRVDSATDAQRAIQIMRVQVPDILIVDWMMEGMSGIELTKHIRSSDESPYPYMPIIMVTAHAEKELVIEARDAGVTEFLVKPIAAAALAQRMSTIIDQPRPFVRAPNYFGPDRRRRAVQFKEPERRTTNPDLVTPEETEHFIEEAAQSTVTTPRNDVEARYWHRGLLGANELILPA
jgi:two-component system chemotaxis response regulator CheY